MGPLDLTDRNAMVTGGAGGIGLGIAKRLLAAGAQVAVTDRDRGRFEQAFLDGVPPGAHLMAGDVSLEAEADALVDRAVEALGGLDILVNNAGIAEPLAPTVNQALGDWQRVVDVNLRGVFLMSRAFGRHILGRRGRGAIVNIASIAGLGGFPASNAYGVSKAGVVQMTRTMAVEWARSGVRVNCVAPGLIDTSLAQALFDEGGAQERLMKRIPMRRLGAVDEIARAVEFLVSDGASYITGATLPVDGGWTANAGG